MNTISRILGPFITLLCDPLVGSSLASDWVRFSKSTSSSTMYHQNVEVYSHSPSYILVILLCICIIKANGHYQQDSRALHHTFVSTCWQFSCLRLGQIFEMSKLLIDNVWPSSVGILSFCSLDIGVLPLYMYL